MMLGRLGIDPSGAHDHVVRDNWAVEQIPEIDVDVSRRFRDALLEVGPHHLLAITTPMQRHAVDERLAEVGIAEELDGAAIMCDDHETASKRSKTMVPH